MIDPNEFVITRKRKKYKFAKFANATNCFEYAEWSPSQVDCIEVGAGTGLLSAHLAARHPDKTFVALDVKADRLQKGAYDALEHNVSNIQFVRARADQLSELFTAHSAEALWVTFPDPFPKKGSAGRRLMHPTFLAQYAQVLRPDGELVLKHDDCGFFHWSLEQLVQAGWTMTRLYFDVHESDAPEEYRLLTTYEQRWLGEGRTTKVAVAQPPKATT